MHTENVVYMQGDPSRIFDLAANIQDWPRVLPHYREVKILEASDSGSRKVVEMACVRNGFPLPGMAFPVRWRSIQLCERKTGRIFFKHTAGVAMGMWVVWAIKPDDWGRGVRVTISHDLSYPFTILNGWFAKDLIGQGFVHEIAGRTLTTIKAIVETEAGL